MNFRSCMFLPRGSRDETKSTWIEAHKCETNFVIFGFTGDPKKVGHTNSQAFRQTERSLFRHPKLPEGAALLGQAYEPVTALKTVLMQEAILTQDHDILEIGSCDFGNVKHYIKLIEEGSLPRIRLPVVTFNAIEECVDKTIDRNLGQPDMAAFLNLVGAQLNLFRKMPFATPGRS